MLPKNLEPVSRSCPVVASFGAQYYIVACGIAARLESVLARGDVPRDIKEYPDVGHSFMNDWRLPGPMRTVERAVGLSYCADEAEDALQRTTECLERHLAEGRLRTHASTPNRDRAPVLRWAQ